MTEWRRSVLCLAVSVTLYGQVSAPSVILDDLEQRNLTALQNIPRAHSTMEVEAQAKSLRGKFEALLRMDRLQDGSPLSATLRYRQGLSTPAPAVVILHPHDDPKNPESGTLTTRLASAGFLVLDLDLRDLHGNLDLLADGVTPESLMQYEVRAALRYLQARTDVDSKRICLVGDGLVATLAAALNPQFFAVALNGGMLDPVQLVHAIRGLTGDRILDACPLIPGLTRTASVQEMIALIMPRPLLAIDPGREVFAYASEIYHEKLRETSESQEITGWLVQWAKAAAPPESAIVRTEIRLPTPAITSSKLPPFTRIDLPTLLGQPLPQGQVSWGLKAVYQQRISLNTQKGFYLPATVYRPGPNGYEPGFDRLLAISDVGEASLENDEIVQEAIHRGWCVWTIDPRGIGKVKPDAAASIFTMSLWLEESFVWRQAQDVMRIAEDWRGASALYAKGPNATAIAALIAAATISQTRPAWIATSDAGGKVPLNIAPFGFDIHGLTSDIVPKVTIITNVEDFIRLGWLGN